MTRKDYGKIAEALRDERPDVYLNTYTLVNDHMRGTYDEWSTIVLRMAKLLRSDNPNFKSDVFCKACGFGL